MLKTKLPLALLLLMGAAFGASEQPAIRVHRSRSSVTGNIISDQFNASWDTPGDPDPTSVPVGGGTTAKASVPIVFEAPPGYRVHILRVQGTFIAFPTWGSTPPGTHSEVSWSLLTTAPSGSTRIGATTPDLPAADDCMIWDQVVVDESHVTPHPVYDWDVSAAGWLEADNTLILGLAVAMNTTGLTLHMEPTFRLEYEFVRQ